MYYELLICGHMSYEYSLVSEVNKEKNGSLTSLALLMAISLSGAISVDPPVKPNIVFVLVDDWGFAEVGFATPK